MNALDLLTDDHQKVKRLFEQAQQIQDNQQKKEMFDKIDMELAIHADIEETVFYPALEEHDALKEMVREARRSMKPSNSCSWKSKISRQRTLTSVPSS